MAISSDCRSPTGIFLSFGLTARAAEICCSGDDVDSRPQRGLIANQLHNAIGNTDAPV